MRPVRQPVHIRRPVAASHEGRDGLQRRALPGMRRVRNRLPIGGNQCPPFPLRSGDGPDRGGRRFPGATAFSCSGRSGELIVVASQAPLASSGMGAARRGEGMITQWFLKTSGDALGRSRAFLGALWQSAGLTGMLLPVLPEGDHAPHVEFLREARRLAEADPFAPLMTSNRAPDVAERARTGLDGPAGAVPPP